MRASKCYSKDILSISVESSISEILGFTKSKYNILSNWVQENIFDNKADCYHLVSNKYGCYIYYISCPFPSLYHLGLISFYGARYVPSPRAKYPSLELAKIAAEEHCKKYFV